MAFANLNHEGKIGEHKYYVNAGIRGQSWFVTNNGISGDNHMTFSPRAQFILRPNWKRDMLFRFSTGFYNQPPFYRELRGYDGSVNEKRERSKNLFILF